MNIKFKRVTLHNFLSYGHSEIELTNKNYCLVRGVNNCPLDNAVSNGSGKSSWISAICWALTGETVQGVTNNIKNIYIDEKECYVTLEFDVNDDSYEVTRIKEPSPNMKIIKNGEDISGKGIRESSIILAQQLPDLNKDLLTSVILLGQGLPNRFTNNSPSGRKEVLEKLSKSDFIIEDIKVKISNRQTKLNADSRALEDSVLSLNTQKTTQNGQLEQLKEELAQESVVVDYDSQIKACEEELEGIDKEVLTLNAEISVKTERQEIFQNQINEELEAYNKAKKEADDKYFADKSAIDEVLNSLKVRNKTLTMEIVKINNIKEVCPTCGRPFEGVTKPDVTPLMEELAQVNKQYDEVEFPKLEVLRTNYNNTLSKLNENVHTKDWQEMINKLGKDINELSTKANSELTTKRGEITTKIETIKLKKQTHEEQVNKLQLKIKTLESSIKDIDVSLSDLAVKQDVLNQHISVVKQMDTLVKRDFRGFLLSNIIEFINKQSKEYCQDIFGTKELEFKLDGNNIDIEYCGKDFASLSGGEKQRVDLIIQFAIRKMLSQYLDFNSNILCLDEIFDNLDAKATTNVINLISNRLTDIESVFIISHHADELGIPSDTEMTIVKDINGISSLLLK